MAWSDWFLPKGAQTSAEAEENYRRLQEDLRAQTERRQSEGTISDDTLVINNLLLETPLDDQNAAASSGFVEGLAEGRDNIKAAINTGVTGTLGGVLKAIPWTVWVIAAVVAFFYLGGSGWLLRRGKGLLK